MTASHISLQGMVRADVLSNTGTAAARALMPDLPPLLAVSTATRAGRMEDSTRVWKVPQLGVYTRTVKCCSVCPVLNHPQYHPLLTAHVMQILATGYIIRAGVYRL